MEPQRARYTDRQTRHKVDDRLSQLLAKLSPPSPISLSQDELQTYHIQCSAMALCPEEKPDSGPLFCELVPPSAMNKAFDSTFTSKDTSEWPGYDPEFGSDFYSALAVGRTLLDYTMSGPIVQEPLIGTEWYMTGQWGVYEILRVDNAHQPHLACVHIDDAPPEEGLRRSELISAIKLMKQAMRLDKRDQFRINPVYVYSFSCHKARILETFYEADTLFVHKTPYIDFAEENRDNIKLYLRWMMNKPSGLTTFAGRNEYNVSDNSDDAESATTHSSGD